MTDYIENFLSQSTNLSKDEGALRQYLDHSTYLRSCYLQEFSKPWTALLITEAKLFCSPAATVLSTGDAMEFTDNITTGLKKLRENLVENLGKHQEYGDDESGPFKEWIDRRSANFDKKKTLADTLYGKVIDATTFFITQANAASANTVIWNSRSELEFGDISSTPQLIPMAWATLRLIDGHWDSIEMNAATKFADVLVDKGSSIPELRDAGSDLIVRAKKEREGRIAAQPASIPDFLERRQSNPEVPDPRKSS